jgi:hypothetical protein
MDIGISSSGPRRSSIFDPIIKPSSKADAAASVSKPFSIEESQGINKNVTAPTPVDTAAKVSAVKSVTKTDGTSTTGPKETIARPISRADIVDQLLHLQKAPSTENIQIMSMILQYGLEASGVNFETVQTLLKGRKSTKSLEPSVVSLSKGLAETPRSVDIIGQFLTNQTQIAQQLQQLQSAMSQFQLGMNLSQSLLDSGLIAGLGSALSELDDSLKKLSKKSGTQLDWAKYNRGAVIQDFKALYEFVGGLRQKLNGTSPSGALSQFMTNSSVLQTAISGFLESLTSQVIMSEQVSQQVGSDRFGYWQFPNPWMQGQSVIELLVRKDPLKKKTEYNSQKTRIILKFETVDLGEMAVTLDVLEQKIWMSVSSNRPESLLLVRKWISQFKEQASAHNYELVGFQSSAKPVDIKQLLLPKLNLDTLSRISTEV